MKHLFSALCLFMCIAMRAQNPSSEMNTSQRKAVGNYQIETSASAYDIAVKVYDKRNRALSCGEFTGHAGFYYPDGSYLEKEFTLVAVANTFIVKIPYPGFLTYKITLTINGKAVSAEFENVCTLKTQPVHDKGQ